MPRPVRRSSARLAERARELAIGAGACLVRGQGFGLGALHGGQEGVDGVGGCRCHRIAFQLGGPAATWWWCRASGVLWTCGGRRPPPPRRVAVARPSAAG